MRTRALVTVLVLVVLVTTAGCVGFGDDNDSELADDADARGLQAEPADDADSGEAPTGDAEDGGASRSADADSPGTEQYDSLADRQLIHTGHVELLVDDVPEASTAIRALTVDQGGFVSESTHEVHEAHNETWRTERLTIRIPSEAFDESMTDLEPLGEVQVFQTDTEDVTDQLVDLDARLENLYAERDQLRDLFEEANETRDVLAVQNELSSVQEEIERLEAQVQTLEERVAFSTITVHLTEEEPEPEADPHEPEWYETSVTNAFLESVGGVVTTIRALVVGIAYAAPYVLVIGPVAAVAIALFRRR